MRMPDFSKFAGWLPGLGLFFSGMIIGSAVYMSIHHHNFNLLYDKYQDLLKEKDDLITEMKTEMNTKRTTQPLISKINVKFAEDVKEENLDDIIENELEKKVRDELKMFIGKPANRLASPEEQDLIRSLVNKRYLVKDKDYIAQIRSLYIIQSELTLWITVKEFIKAK